MNPLLIFLLIVSLAFGTLYALARWRGNATVA